MMDVGDSLRVVGTALALGLLVGLQRERAQHHPAGIRTFALITVLGAMSGIMAQEMGWWMAGVALVAVAGMLLVNHLLRLRADPASAGLTTDIAALVMFADGAYLAVGHAALAVVIGGGVAILLQLKKPLHEYALAISERDFTAIMRFVLISLVILPVLPKTNYGPPGYQVINLYETWLMVVLIVGIGLGGYVLLKLFGEKAGNLLGGLLGGLVSSTATTVSFARRAKGSPEIAGMAAMVVVLASAVSLLRVVALAGAVAPQSLVIMAPPLLTFCGMFVVLFAISWFFSGTASSHVPEHGNPAELKPALIFGGLYAVITLLVAVSRGVFGDGALYPVAVISGLTDLDAIALTTARMIERVQLDADLGWRLILVATMSNLVFKGLIAALLGGRTLGWRVAVWFGLAMVGGTMVLIFWK
jgi:uncharacterized membrane protein (DUF4010 family)